MKDLISFKTAKLLSEFNYNKPCKFSYDEDGLLTENAEQLGNFKAYELSNVVNYIKKKYCFKIVTNKTKIVSGEACGFRYHWLLFKNNDFIISDKIFLGFFTKEQALDSAIFETLTYLKQQ